MTRPRLLDLYCCEGGAAAGFQRAGFDVYGVDLLPKFAKRYVGEGFHAGSALDVLTTLIAGGSIPFTLRDGTIKHLLLSDFVAIHASPPCQGYSIATAGNPEARGKHERLIAATRTLLEQTGKPWVIENVEQALSQMNGPITLCGRMFGLEAPDEDGLTLVLDRHRLFESNVPLIAPAHPKHDGRQVAGVYGGSRRSSKPNATPADDRYAARFERHGGYVPRSTAVQQALLDIDWMTQNGMNQSLPPAYTEWVGLQLRQRLMAVAA